jgi:RNA polymerase sigma-70 factor, ECF subfamily
MSVDTDRPELDEQLEGHRTELTGYCYRMLGSAFDADDAVQETMVRAWRGYDGFEGRSSLRSWLYRIATNVCLDQIKGRQRRARPMDMGPSGGMDPDLGPVLPESAWVDPVPDAKVLPADLDPGEQTVARESIHLAFVAALANLPPKQRAVLILREVLRWSADEVAGLLDTTVASVNSALQRARATLSDRELSDLDAAPALDEGNEALVASYCDAFERYDMAELTALLREDAILSMPPYSLWLQGHEAIAAWMLGPGIECKGSKMVRTSANGLPAFGQYRPSGPGGVHEPWALQVLEVADGKVVGLNAFLDTDRLFPLFGLPASPD